MLNEVLENIKSRRSVRTYTEQQVSAENLNLIIGSGSVCSQRYEFPDMAFHSHSGC